jgi:hypothetical protein
METISSLEAHVPSLIIDNAVPTWGKIAGEIWEQEDLAELMENKVDMNYLVNNYTDAANMAETYATKNEVIMKNPVTVFENLHSLSSGSKFWAMNRRIILGIEWRNMIHPAPSRQFRLIIRRNPISGTSTAFQTYYNLSMEWLTASGPVIDTYYQAQTQQGNEQYIDLTPREPNSTVIIRGYIGAYSNFWIAESRQHFDVNIVIGNNAGDYIGVGFRQLTAPSVF